MTRPCSLIRLTERLRPIRPLLDVNKLTDEYGGMGFTGAFVGMFCIDMAEYANYADFEYFTYSKAE